MVHRLLDLYFSNNSAKSISFPYDFPRVHVNDTSAVQFYAFEYFTTLYSDIVESSTVRLCALNNLIRKRRNSVSHCAVFSNKTL